jgi:hypothetical protein
MDLWRAAYPAVNIETEIQRAAAWQVANPQNRKQNYRRFLTNWFARAQEKARPGVKAAPSNPYRSVT